MFLSRTHITLQKLIIKVNKKKRVNKMKWKTFEWKLIASWVNSVNCIGPKYTFQYSFHAFKFNLVATLIFHRYGLWLGGIKDFVYECLSYLLKLSVFLFW